MVKKSIIKHRWVDTYVGKDFYGEYVSQVFQQSSVGEICICGRKDTITKIYKRGSLNVLDLCIDCTAKYNLNHYHYDKRKNGLAFLIMKGKV